jgi:hypothetical protein
MKIFVIIDNFNRVRVQLDYGIEMAKLLDAELILYDLQQIPQFPSELRLTYEDYVDSRMETKVLMSNAKKNLTKLVQEIRKEKWLKTDFVLDVNFYSGEESQSTITRNRLIELKADLVIILKAAESEIPNFIKSYEVLAKEEKPVAVMHIPETHLFQPWSNIYYVSRNVRFPSKNMTLVSSLANVIQADVHISYSSDLKKSNAVNIANSNEECFRASYPDGNLTFELYRKTSCYDMIRSIQSRDENDLLILEQNNPKYFSRMFRDWRVHRAFHINTSPIMFLTDNPNGMENFKETSS